MRPNSALAFIQLLLLIVLAVREAESRTATEKNVSPGCADCQVEKDPNDCRFFDMAEDSMVKYLKDNGYNYYYKILKINNVTEQVVAGFLYRIDFDAFPTNCDLNSNVDTFSYSNCKVLDTSKYLNCRSKIWDQPWSSHIIETNCEAKHIVKRQIPGGVTDQDPTNPVYVDLATESLKHYVKEEGLTEPYKVLEVIKATTQVVTGFLTRIDFYARLVPSNQMLLCHSKIWEKPWLSQKDFNVSCNYINQEPEKKVPFGGPVEKDVNDPKYNKLAEESLRKYQENIGSSVGYHRLNIVKVTEQLVAGWLTRIDFYARMVLSNQMLLCHSRIWEQPWLNRTDFNVSCNHINQAPEKEVPIGGPVEKDVNDPKYNKLAEESLRKYQENIGSSVGYHCLNIVKVTEQLVAGWLTRIDFYARMVLSNQMLLCHSRIWEQPWLNRKDFNVSCNHINQAPEKEVPIGGPVENSSKRP